MSLTVDGRAAMLAMAGAPDRFDRIKSKDWSSAAVKFARKQLTAAGQDRTDIRDIKNVLGEDIFEKSLDALSAMHAKQLARRIDPAINPDDIKTGAMALEHVRKVIADDWVGAEAGASPSRAEASTPDTDDVQKPSNPYIGRKAFRTGR